MALLIRNLSQLATPLGTVAARGAAMRDIRVVDDAAIVVRDGRFAYAGAERDLPSSLRGAITDEVDARGGTALPGFVDSHTHLPFAGARESEFNRRLSGETYEQIAAGGGGIASTVNATRAASETALADLVLGRARRMAAHGTTTAEAKSGYGLNLADELKQLRAIRAASASSPVRLVPTCLAAHEIPPEARGSAGAREAYIREVVEQIQPAAARDGLARFCDVFVERGVYSRDEGERILRAGAASGLTPRIHADELSDTGGASLAAALGAASADHLMYVSDEGIRALAASGTIANLLPATSLFLMAERFAPARQLIAAGAAVSLSTDCNPGSSMTESMQLVVQLACLRMKMTVEEALTAATLNGAASVGLGSETGSIEPGKRADLTLLDAPSYLHL
ncbi:MAG TPA: imidazolonepropionase, partial [Thermoanaerobaculia bacterium]|nr:imidazolonepropionase [Thermoanaerobaculia bacterium]